MNSPAGDLSTSWHAGLETGVYRRWMDNFWVWNGFFLWSVIRILTLQSSVSTSVYTKHPFNMLIWKKRKRSLLTAHFFMFCFYYYFWKVPLPAQRWSWSYRSSFSIRRSRASVDWTIPSPQRAGEDHRKLKISVSLPSHYNTTHLRHSCGHSLWLFLRSKRVLEN